MKKIKKAGYMIIPILIWLIGTIGYKQTGVSLSDSAYRAFRMYTFDADTSNDNFLVEIARWVAPFITVGGLIIILKSFVNRMTCFFTSFFGDAVAIYGDSTLADVLAEGMKHSIRVVDNEPVDVKEHIIMFDSDEDSLSFYKRNKYRLDGSVYIKNDSNDSFSVGLKDVKFFNPSEIIARNFWRENDLCRVLTEKKLKISIVGSDILSRKLLSYGLLNNIYSAEQEIEYHLFTSSDTFQTMHSDMVMANKDTITYHKLNSGDDLSKMADSDIIIITDGVNNIFISELTKLTDGEIFVFDPIGTFVNIYCYDKIKTFGMYTDVLTEDNIKTDIMLRFAKELNYQYAKCYKKNEELLSMEEEWDLLSPFVKGSNVASTDYIEIVVKIMNALGKTEVDNELGYLEHLRWCRYHYFNHWKYGEVRNNDAHIHNCLVDWDELGQENKEKDINGLKTLLDLRKTLAL